MGAAGSALQRAVAGNCAQTAGHPRLAMRPLPPARPPRSFDGAVKLKAICVIGGSGGSAPSKMRA